MIKISSFNDIILTQAFRLRVVARMINVIKEVDKPQEIIKYQKVFLFHAGIN